ncbi:MAG: 2-C-methyl-D-erythritol 2,4-cyclodiphosphate synthase [Ruminococcaceae bacterium]|nr:2-C-methyl-D-erythritol 2,4-cyclodiphosphate synthase [Oscillospiraceae bacterium]
MKNLRIGHGYDAHRFTEGRPLMLGGIAVPYEKGLDGHSDADVLLHAITDAMLGAAAMGDIGKHFPDTDEAYRGANSLELLQKTAALLRKNGYVLQNLDATVIAQAPKLAPYIEDMRASIAGALLVPVSAVSVKATTTERMGFEGRCEGISCHAVCLLKNFNTP